MILSRARLFFGKQKALSPVIATVLLIAMVVVIGLIIFLWFKGITDEAITKFGTNVELVCEDIEFDASYSGGMLYFSNLGNVPIFGIKVKIVGEGSYETKDLRELSEDWSEAGLNQGGVFSGNLVLGEGTNKLMLIPVLIGNSESGEKTFVCGERHGYEIII